MTGLELLKQNIARSHMYFRSTLNVAEQKAYDKMLEGFLDFSGNISVFGVNADSIQDIFDKIRRDVPEVFFVENASFQYMPVVRSAKVQAKYRFSKEQVDATLLSLYKKCREILKDAYSMTDLQKEKLIHDYFCENVVYDDAFSKSSFECVGPLLFGKGVCEGISRAAKMLFDLAGVRSLVVHGESNQQQGFAGSSSNLHAWNMVNIDNEFYHLDITFDLTVQAFGVVRYDYFNLSDNSIRADHVIYADAIPKCNKDNSYYRAHGMFMMTQNDFSEYLVKCIKLKKKDIVFQLPVVSDLNRAKKELEEIIARNAFRTFSFLSRYQLSSNETQFVFHLHFV